MNNNLDFKTSHSVKSLAIISISTAIIGLALCWLNVLFSVFSLTSIATSWSVLVCHSNAIHKQFKQIHIAALIMGIIGAILHSLQAAYLLINATIDVFRFIFV